MQEQVIAPDWLELQFSIGLLSPREFLRRCERRYEDVVPAAPAQAAKPEMMLVELYAREHKRLLGDSRELADYRGDVLRWALLEVPSRIGTGVTVSACREGPAPFVTEWGGEGSKRWLFVIEEGSHALNWRTITTRAVALHRDNAAATTLAVRIPTQLAIPQPHWGMVGPEIEEAERTKALRIVTLTPDQLARIYAAWELYTQACQGDIPHEPDSVMRFAAQRFQSWYASLRGAKTMEEIHDASAPGEILAPLPEVPVAMVLVTVPVPKIEESTVANGAALSPAAVPSSENISASAPAAEAPKNGAEPASVDDCMRQIISSRRFASYVEIAAELSAKAGREVPLAEAAAAAEATGDIRVYNQGANAGFLWQGW